MKGGCFMIRILIADDQNLLRKSLSLIFQIDDEIKVIKQVSNGIDAVEQTILLEPDIVLLDIEMPELNGLKALKEIKQKTRHTKVVILTTFDTSCNIEQAFLYEADAYISKEIAPQDLINTIKCVHSGLTVIDRSVTEYFTTQLQIHEKSQLDEDLNEEEIAIIRLVVEGNSNKDIAEELNYAEGTVKNKISKLYTKLGLNDRLQLAVFAIEKGV